MFAGIARISLPSLAALLVFAVGGSSVNAAPAAAFSPTPRAAVLQMVRPFTGNGAPRASCNPVMGRLAACPITPRLRSAVARENAWERAHISGGAGNEFCRCQNVATRIDVLAAGKPYTLVIGHFARINTVWHYSTNIVRLTYTVQSDRRGWQVDNITCTGHPRRDLYHIPVGPCPM